MMTHVRESRFSLIFFALLLTFAVYGLRLAVKNYSHEESKEICTANENPQVIELLDSEAELELNVSKLIRSLIKSPSEPRENFKVLDPHASDTGDLEFSIFLNIEWQDGYSNNKSKAYDSLKLSLMYVIEDLYDKEFNLEKSITTSVDRIEKLPDGILTYMKASPVADGQELNPEELQTVIKRSSVKLLDEILKKSLGKDNEKSGEENVIDDYYYDNGEATESAL